MKSIFNLIIFLSAAAIVAAIAAVLEIKEAMTNRE